MLVTSLVGLVLLALHSTGRPLHSRSRPLRYLAGLSPGTGSESQAVGEGQNLAHTAAQIPGSKIPSLEHSYLFLLLLAKNSQMTSLAKGSAIPKDD